MSELSSKARRRATLFVFLIAAQILLVAAIWQYHQVLVAVYDDAVSQTYTRLFGGAGDGDGLQRKAVRAAVLVSEHTQRVDENPEHQRILAQRWVDFLIREEAGAHLLTNLTAKGVLSSYNVLVLPRITAMSDDEIAAVKSYLKSGGGVIMTWATGTRDEEGEWRDRSPLNHLLGARMAEPPAPYREDQSALLVSARSPLGRQIPPGFLLDVRRANVPVSIVPLEPRVKVAAEWVESAVRDVEAEAGGTTSDTPPRAAVVHAPYYEGRVAWLGFDIDSGGSGSQQYRVFGQLLKNALVWTAQQAHVYKVPWPDGRSSAFSLSIEVHHPDEVDLRLLTLVQQYDLPLTLYAAANSLLDDPERWRGLAQWAELAVWDDAPMPESGLNREAIRRLKALREAVLKLQKMEQVGYRHSEGRITETQLDHLVRARYAYVSQPEGGTQVPEIVRAYRPIRYLTRVRELWAMPELSRGGDQVMDRLASYFQHVQETGGYLNWVLAPDQITDGFIRDLDRFMGQALQDHVWLASAGEVSAHWRLWGNISLATTYPGRDRVGIRLSNTGLETAREVTFEIELGWPEEELDIRPSTLGSPSPIRSTQDGIHWNVYIPKIAPGKNYAYLLHLNE